MAKAVVYDEFEDVGLALTDEAVREWDMEAWALERVDYLVFHARVLLKRASIPGMDKVDWCEEFAKGILDCAAWYCRITETEGLDREAARTLPSPQSGQGKMLASSAQGIDSKDYLSGFAGDADRAMVHVVTIGRRCTHWKKADQRLSNKLANAVNKERSLTMKMHARLESHSS